MSNLYNNYFAKDKPLRHYTQHLIIALFGYFLVTKFGVTHSAHNLLLFILFSYTVDIDGLVSVFIFKKRIKEADDIVKALTSLKFIESATLATIHHKKLNKLVLHNVVGLTILVVVFSIALVLNNEMLTILTWATLCHFVFDIFDDFYQLGHINNWLWPLKHLSKPLK